MTMEGAPALMSGALALPFYSQIKICLLEIFFREHMFPILKEDDLIQGCARSLKHMLTEEYACTFAFQ
jgi:hypothetical protein